MLRRTLLVGVTALVGSGIASRYYTRVTMPRSGPSRSPPAIRTEGAGPVKSVSIRPVPLGAGGFVTGMDQSRDGKRFVCRTDVCDAYVRDEGDPAWRPLFSPASLARADLDTFLQLNQKADGRGVAGVRIAPSDKDVLYASYCGYIWRSDDGGKTVRKTAFPQKTMPSNAGPQRLFNRIIDVHPTDANQIIVGTWGDGIWSSRDGGEHWDEISVPRSIPQPDGTLGISLVQFGSDPAHVYIFVGGVGLFASTRGLGGPFARVANGPTQCSSMVASGSGALHLCEYMPGRGGILWTYRPASGWSSYKTGQELFAVAVSPKDPNRLFACGPYGYVARSNDAGASFSDAALPAVEGDGEVGWITELKSLIVAEVIWDHVDPERIWIAHGVGVARGDLTSATRRDWSAGIEELACVSGVSVPGVGTVLTALDKPLWLVRDENAYNNRPAFPAAEGLVGSIDAVTHGSYVDYAADDPHFIVGMLNSGSMFNVEYGPGFSSDGGKNWTRFPGSPPHGWGMGGCIAASTKQNLIVLTSNNGFGATTFDGGATWTTIKLDGVHETERFSNAYYVNRKNITADKTRPGTFALVYTVMQEPQPVFGNPLGGVWLTRDGGRTWRQVLRGLIKDGPSHDPLPVVPTGQDPRQFWQCQLDYVPGHSGELVYTAHADSPDDRLWWSRDDGANWTELHGSIRNVVSFGLGKPAPGQKRPALYFIGAVDGIGGLFASFDWCATRPVLLSREPSQQLCPAVSVVGDVDRFGRAWVGTAGAGWLAVDVELAATAVAPAT